MRVFLSSTCYDLEDLRAVLERAIQSLGYEALLSDRLTFPVDPRVHRHEVCVREAAAADLMLVVIDRRFGAPYAKDPSISVTWAEYRAAVQAGVPVFACVRRGVFDERLTWLKNDKSGLPAHCDDARTFEFISEIQGHPHGTWIDVAFSNVTEIEDRLRVVTGQIERFRRAPRPGGGVPAMRTGTKLSPDQAAVALEAELRALTAQRDELAGQQNECHQTLMDRGYLTWVRPAMMGNVVALGGRISAIQREIDSMERSLAKVRDASRTGLDGADIREGAKCPFCDEPLHMYGTRLVSGAFREVFQCSAAAPHVVFGGEIHGMDD
ncbi:MAG: DUF4062 domain-containing protein [Planctomycetes bacterium]|nr:DUF4062 domain-containing protein [Planctomycetota bacterium]